MTSRLVMRSRSSTRNRLLEASLRTSSLMFFSRPSMVGWPPAQWVHTSRSDAKPSLSLPAARARHRLECALSLSNLLISSPVLSIRRSGQLRLWSLRRKLAVSSTLTSTSGSPMNESSSSGPSRQAAQKEEASRFRFIHHCSEEGTEVSQCSK